jgi:predicted RNase H-like HicB family nuclease
VTIAVHAGQTVPLGTLNAVLAQAGLTADELRALLLEIVVRHYTTILEYDPNAQAQSATFPALPGCTARGTTINEPLARGKEAVLSHLAALEVLGEPIP